MLAKGSSLKSMSIGIGIATGVYGLSFGALSTAAGLDLLQTQALSVLMFSGASQFAFIGIMAASGGTAAFGAAIVSAWLLGVRNGFYAVSLNPILQRTGLAKLIPAHLTIDESTGVAMSQDTNETKAKGFYWTGAAVFVFWNLMTFAGALLGNALGDPRTWGLDAAAAAAFLGLLWPRLKQLQAGAVAAAAMLVAVVMTPLAPTGTPVLIAGVVAVLVGAFNWFGRKDSK